MATRAAKLLVIGLGGTWCMTQKAHALPQAFEGERVPSRLGSQFDFLAAFPCVREFAAPEFHELVSIDSSNMGPEHWTLVSQFIADRHANYEGVVVLQGTDTLAFTAAALSCALHGIGKPVVLTGAQVSLHEVGSDAPANVINACRLAARSSHPALRRVVVAFGSRIILGSRCRKYSECDLEAFDSVNVPPIGRFRTAVVLERCDGVKAQPRRPFVPAPAFNRDVALVALYPGIRPSVLRSIGELASGVVIAAFGAGNIPSSGDALENPLSLEGEIRRIVECGKPVVVTTQCVTGQAEIGRYEAGSRALRAGAIIANDMTPEMATVKLSWLLANEEKWHESPEARRALRRGKPKDALRYAMLHAYCGELASNQRLFGQGQ